MPALSITPVPIAIPHSTNGLAQIAIILGNICLGGLFVIGGVMHMLNFGQVAQLLAALIPRPSFVLTIGTIFQIGAGVLLMCGIAVVPAALGLIGFTVVATLMVLRFWTMPVGPCRHATTNTFLSNIGIDCRERPLTGKKRPIRRGRMGQK